MNGGGGGGGGGAGALTGISFCVSSKREFILLLLFILFLICFNLFQSCVVVFF